MAARILKLPNVSLAIRENAVNEFTATVTNVNNANPAVGSAGSVNNAGGIAGADSVPMLGSGDVPYLNATFSVGGVTQAPITFIQAFQLNNPQLDTALRIGGPVLAVFLYGKGYHGWATALVGASAVLWWSRHGA